MSQFFQKSAQRMAVESGLGSVSNMARMSGRSRQTLHNWHRDYPALFELVLLGCVAKLKATETVTCRDVVQGP